MLLGMTDRRKISLEAVVLMLVFLIVFVSKNYQHKTSSNVEERCIPTRHSVILSFLILSISKDDQYKVSSHVKEQTTS
jgi:hypothetical protein